jgi:hypothetical protein
MALDAETKSNIIYYLGLPAKTLIESSTHYNSIIADRLNNLDANTEDIVESLLDEISTARTALKGAPNSFKVKQVGDIVFNTDSGKDLASSEYKRLRKELSDLLDIPLKSSSNMVGICL